MDVLNADLPPWYVCFKLALGRFPKALAVLALKLSAASNQDLHPRTLNEYQFSLSSFVNWMLGAGRLHRPAS